MPDLFLLASVAGLALAGYALACALAPFGCCRRGHHPDSHCRACAGTGRRVRLGRRLWTYLRALYEPDSRRPPTNPPRHRPHPEED
jgi:hypothetical protein